MSDPDSSEKLFKIAIPDSELETLKKKLELTRFPDELEGAGKDYGAPLADVRRLTEYWKNGYDWRKFEAELNDELPHFTRDVEVDGFGALNIHYVHKKSAAADAIPLLFVHGWPGSFLEVRKVLPLLLEASPEHPSFHVVALSLPGYGFSEAPRKKGFEGNQMAETGHKLMLALGYNEYVVQGGDWGALIGRTMAQLYGPKHVKAWHTNMPLAYPPHPTKRPVLLLRHLLFNYNAKDQAALKHTQDFVNLGSSYSRQHGTRPQTLSYGLADSPSGLLAWIYEKLYAWTDDYPWTDDEILTWISIYWFSRAGPSASLRIYYEVQQARGEGGFISNLETKVPTGYSYFPKEIVSFPKRWYTYGFPNVIFESDHDSGGHFAATEKPQELVDDLRKMYGKGGPAFAVVPGKTGYV
ncbi:epoxide hydrolase [Coprinopsis marcescibilis]|uniref:Epoxide hydrolase n=1 Tax=Coprinopsis marcescibilis TaxID=230819 RepID=A0A5C3KWB2_COPMA|nr:epoxide hydrolase [Coprinopsis marcescibilis]